MEFLEEIAPDSDVAARWRRHRDCARCSVLEDRENAFQEGGREANDTHLPPTASDLAEAKRLDDGSHATVLKRWGERHTTCFTQTTSSSLGLGLPVPAAA